MGYKWGILVTDTTNVSVEYMKYNKCVFSINEASKNMHVNKMQNFLQACFFLKLQ